MILESDPCPTGIESLDRREQEQLGDAPFFAAVRLHSARHGYAPALGWAEAGLAEIETRGLLAQVEGRAA